MRRHILPLVLALAATTVQAQAPVRDPALDRDTAGVLTVVAAARTALATFPRIWGRAADGTDWIFVRRNAAFVTTQRAGIEHLEPIDLPAGTQRANMSVEVRGRRYAMVLLPLPEDRRTGARLLVHEASHTLQPQALPHPGGTEPSNADADLLDLGKARVWFFLELRALARALATTGDARRLAAHDALRFRAARDSMASADELRRQAALDLAEGIPEYNGWKATRSPVSELIARLEATPRRNTSWVRAASYETGPAYGLLLDALQGEHWHERWRTGAPLPELLREAVGAPRVTQALETRGRRYGYDSIAPAELARDRARTERLAGLRRDFVDRDVLRVVPKSLRVSFDPNGQTPIGPEGTVMLGFRWATEDGAELVAGGGALVAKDWSHFQVPLGTIHPLPGTLTAPATLEGPGWRLTVPTGWRFTRVENRLELRPPEN